MTVSRGIPPLFNEAVAAGRVKSHAITLQCGHVGHLEKSQ